MRKRIAISLAAVLAVAGCDFKPVPTPNEQLAQKAKSEVRDSLKDPTSAKFKEVRASAKGNCVYGKVLAKNSYGAYNGYQDFVWIDGKTVFSPDQSDLLIEAKTGGSDNLSALAGLRARFQIKRLGRDNRWVPTFKFMLGNGEKSVALTITGIAGKKVLIPWIEYSASAKAKGEIFQTPLEVGQTADLIINWTAEGDVTINLCSTQSLAACQTGETHTAKLGGVPTKFRLTGSTGEIEVLSFQLGTTGSL